MWLLGKWLLVRCFLPFFFCIETVTTEISANAHTLSLPGALPMCVLAAQTGGKHGAREALRRHAMLAVATGLAFALLWSAYGLRFHAGDRKRTRLNSSH